MDATRQMPPWNEMDLHVIPEPWSYNPSRWGERVIIAIVAGVAALISGYMGLFQLGLIATVWDPVFGEQSARVLTSDISHTLSQWFRVPDAIMGMLAYLADVILVLAGSTRRWQFRPWLIATFGLVVIPLGLVSVTLVALQGAVLGTWCLLCLITAMLSLLLIVLAWDEVWSTARYMRLLWLETGDYALCWQTFWGRASDRAWEIGNQMSRRP